jgi:predicted phage tail protein
MKKFDRYKFYQYVDEQGRQVVVAVSRHAGRTVKGYAKCDPDDEFDLELGKKLAAARCAVKIAKKRNANANAQKKKAYNELVAKQNRLQKMNDYVDDSRRALNAANSELAAIEASMK